MSDEPTCGKGLAEHSVLPARLAAVAAAMAEVLEHHRTSLDVVDADARAEHDAYTTLAHDFRGIAAMLQAAAERMAGYRDLPMAPHDEEPLSSAEAVAKFEHLVGAERELQELLRESVERGQGMLSAMRGDEK